MTSQFIQCFFIALIFFQFNCVGKHQTPEEVITQYTELVSKGECEKAIKFCDDEGKLFVEGDIEAGCTPVESSIESLNCEIRDTIARCVCYENRSGFSLYKGYKLLLIEDEWKINDMNKDAAIWE